MHYDALYYNCNIYNTPYRKFIYGFFTVKNGKFAYVGLGEPGNEITADVKKDLEGKRVIPGLIDIHTHIESSMLTPMAFAAEECRHGITTLVCEPHEIANVAGNDGVFAMIEAAEGAPCDIYYGIPSSVPASSPELETTGGIIDVEELREIAMHPSVRCLGEVMNQKDVVDNPDGRSNRLIREFQKCRPDLPVEGHVPRISGERLAVSMYNGIDSDHTEHTFEEFLERYRFGMMVQIQEKCVKENLIRHVVDNNLYDNTCFVTDDVMPDELVNHGALDHVLRLAVKAGFPFEQAIYCSTKTPAVRMRFFDRGEIRPGMLADFVVLKDEKLFEASEVFMKGSRTFAGEERKPAVYPFPERFYDTIKCAPFTEDSFTVKAEGDKVKCRYIGVHSDRTQTTEEFFEFDVKNGEIVFGEDTPNLCAVFERYGKTNNGHAFGFMGGDCHYKGAVACTYNHDHHNVFVSGSNKKDMVIAAERVREMHGGFAVVLNGEILAEAQLRVGGIISEVSAKELGDQINAVTNAMVSLGYKHEDPIMSFCTVPLTVSPALKISDIGLINVMESKLVSLFVD